MNARGRAPLHPPLRLRLTFAFAAAMALLLTGLGLFIYARFETGLDQSLNQGLRSRANDVRALVNQADTGLADAGGTRLSRTGTGFAQVLMAGGKVLDQTPGLPRRPVLSPRVIRSAGMPLKNLTLALPFGHTRKRNKQRVGQVDRPHLSVLGPT